MNLPGQPYLLTLAVVSTTYVGFAALLVGLRQAKGSHLTTYDAYFTAAFVQLGFIVTACGLIPPLIALYDCPPDIVWRLSGVLAAIPILLFVATLPRRRRAATGMPVPGFVRGVVTVQGFAGVLLLLNALLWPAKTPAIYATAVTLVLFSSALGYLFALEVIRPDVGKRDD